MRNNLFVVKANNLAIPVKIKEKYILANIQNT